MLRRTLMRSAQEARRPLIQFPDRKAASQSQRSEHTPHPHPAAPEAVAKDFEHFQEVFTSGPHFHPEKVQQAQSSAADSSSSSSSASKDKGATSKDVAEDIHDLPRRFWATPALVFEEQELDAVMSGGATLVQPK